VHYFRTGDVGGAAHGVFATNNRFQPFLSIHAILNRSPFISALGAFDAIVVRR